MSRYFLLCIVALAISSTEFTAAQATVPQIATSSQGACTAFAKPHSDSPKANAINAPRLVYTVDPENLPGAPKHPLSGITEVALLVDISGNPQQVHVEKSLGPKYDKVVVAAVQQYRFKPALQHGKPVQVKICVGINFRIY
ncbi:MAG TPA: energy transducer TonB [Acidobacteriaceae bacterium]|nr:energy transducer TonB [Acidobacteriaceae bacterium]